MAERDLRLYSRHIAIGVRRDLNVPHDPGPAKIPLTVRQLQPGDDLSLIADVPGLASKFHDAVCRLGRRWCCASSLWGRGWLPAL